MLGRYGAGGLKLGEAREWVERGRRHRRFAGLPRHGFRCRAALDRAGATGGEDCRRYAVGDGDCLAKPYCTAE